MTGRGGRVLHRNPAPHRGSTSCHNPASHRSSTSCASCSQASKSNLLSQGIVLAVLLVVSVFVRFPVFCLICPIGLALGSLYAVSRLFVLWQPGWELLLFPAMLLIEIFLFKRWCSSICPLGFFFGLLSKLRTRIGFAFAPRVDKTSCRASQACVSCSMVCPEDIDVSSAHPRDFEDCTLCLDCVENCPTKSLSLKLLTEKAMLEADGEEQDS